MTTLFSIIIFILGTSVGSFLNCIIYRLPKEKSFLKGRSYCPRCSHKLAWYDLIPILSFLIQRGKCRYCNKRISLQYPLVELITGVLFVLIFNFSFQDSFQQGKQLLDFSFHNLTYFIYLLIISSFLVIIFVSDLKRFIIPDKIIYPACLSALIFNSYSGFIQGKFDILKQSLLSAVLTSFLFFLLFLFSRGKWLGFGDVKLVFFMGLFLGYPEILAALFFSFFIGGIIGLGLMIFGKAGLKTEIPFGPFLIIGTLIGLFEGQHFINWYISLVF